MEYIKVSGNIVSELSEKVPNYLVALNELIKNSYDANSETVSIKLDSEKKTLVITDKGDGMDIDDIKSLIHISKSSKEYAKVKENGWIVQGSKGLGFLAVFKFGNLVTWTTKTAKGGGLQFSFDYNELVSQDNITDFGIKVKNISDIDKGTKIEITISDESYNSILEYFSNDKNINKVLHSFTPNDFYITLKIDNKEYTNTPRVDFTEILKDRQLFRIEFNSEDNNICYYRGSHLLLSKKFDIVAADFKVNLKLIAYSLIKNDKKKISSLFYNYLDELTPLIYINTNLFNNYDLFNPNITQKIKYEKILNQMIGVIEIYSKDKRLDFNSDRTNFIQNAFTDGITQFLKELNIKIQTYGSEIKPHISKQDFLEKLEIIYNSEDELTDEELLKNVKDKFYFKNKVSVKRIDNDHVEYSIFDISQKVILKKASPEKDHTPKPKPKCAVIELKNTHLTLFTNDKQVNLRDNIRNARDSGLKKINVDEINILIDGVASQSGILPSIEVAKTMEIKYQYVDEVTGITTAIMMVVFNDRGLEIEKPKEILIPNPIKNGYKLKNPMFTSRIVSQLNSIENLIAYDAVIAASLRSVFETATDEIYSSGEYPNLFISNALEERVEAIVNYGKSNNTLLNTIDKHTKLSFKNLQNNIYKPTEYKEKVIKCHSGAHKSSQHLSIEEIKSIGKSLSYYLILVDFLL